jgi:diaminopimelate epimerase
MHFAKLEALGNDFIIVKGDVVPEADYTDLAKDVCDRHFGIGADGLVFFWKCQAAADFQMRIFNADGGEAEMSGNGLRCLAAHLYQQRLHETPELKIATQTGLKTLQLAGKEPPEYLFAVDMGVPILELDRIPFRPPQKPDSLIGYSLPVEDKIFPVTITSMGNPHCSIFVRSFEEIDWEKIGAQIEMHPFFPQRTNVEFIQVKSRGEIEVRFWERGVGKTLASGTGSCAATVASVLNGQVDSSIQVITLGGLLEMQWRPGGVVHLKGPARSICEGEFYRKRGANRAC